MKLANYDGRAALVLDGSMADVHDASGGRFGPDPMSLYQDWPAFADFAAGLSAGTAALDESRLGCPVPGPRQVFAIGLNYRSHAEESGMALPSVPATFTKFPGPPRAASTSSRLEFSGWNQSHLGRQSAPTFAPKVPGSRPGRPTNMRLGSSAPRGIAVLVRT